jgi:hypothetical protein
VLARFANPAIRHLLSQIAWDGSQKLPYRLLDTVRDALSAGRPIDRLAIPIAAWLRFLARAARQNQPITDPCPPTSSPAPKTGAPYSPWPPSSAPSAKTPASSPPSKPSWPRPFEEKETGRGHRPLLPH